MGAAGAASTASGGPGGRLLHRYSGSGNAHLGTIVVRSRSLLVWRARRPPIQIFTSKGFILVNGRTTSGSIELSRGAYTGTRVATRAGWTVELRARS